MVEYNYITDLCSSHMPDDKISSMARESDGETEVDSVSVQGDTKATLAIDTTEMRYIDSPSSIHRFS